mgnify:CR=1 FL=1
MPDSPRYLPMVPGVGAEEPASTAPPVFERVAVVGVGLIGGSIALAARKAWPSALVIGLDRHEVLERAMVRHAVDVASTDPMIISAADLVVLATPVAEIVRLLAALPQLLADEAIVTDVGSVKREVLEAASALPARLTFVGGHPLAGMAGSGFENARTDLFAGRPWLLAPPGAPGDRGRDALGKLSSFVAGLGAVPVEVPSAEAHDDLMASMGRVVASLEALHPALASPEALEHLAAAALRRLERP